MGFSDEFEIPSKVETLNDELKGITGFAKKFPTGQNSWGENTFIFYFEKVEDGKFFAQKKGKCAIFTQHKSPIYCKGVPCFATVVFAE